MSGKRKSKFMSALSVLIMLLVVALAVGLVFKYTKAGDKIKDIVNPAFRVEYDGKNYDGDENKIYLPTKGQAQFKVKGAESYKVSITPNVTPETDFTYEIGNTVYSYSQVDLSRLFMGSDSIKNGSFYLNCLADYSLESVLSKLHDGATIQLNGSVKYPYLLTFTADNTTVTFLISTAPIINLSESNIIF